MSFYKEEAERDLRYILTTLYQERGELRGDILALDDAFFLQRENCWCISAPYADICGSR